MGVKGEGKWGETWCEWVLNPQGCSLYIHTEVAE